LYVAPAWIREEFLIPSWRIFDLRTGIRGLECGKERFEFALGRISLNDRKLALREPKP